MWFFICLFFGRNIEELVDISSGAFFIVISIDWGLFIIVILRFIILNFRLLISIRIVISFGLFFRF
jgi:hypothetical protein